MSSLEIFQSVGAFIALFLFGWWLREQWTFLRETKVDTKCDLPAACSECSRLKAERGDPYVVCDACWKAGRTGSILQVPPTVGVPGFRRVTKFGGKR